MRKDLNIKTIRFPITSDQKLQKLADKCGLTKLNFFIYMVDYFYKSKKDPRDLNDELLKKELVKRTDTIIAFIKTMEEELLRPLKRDGERIIKVQGSIVTTFNEHIIKHHNEHKDALISQSVKIDKIEGILQKLETAQLQKNNLKVGFSGILEYYIKSRENMGMVTKQVDKENLVQNVRQQLKNL